MEGADLNPEEQLRISRSRIDQLQRENARLVEKFKVVVKMNNHWQRYDSQREEHVLKMTQTNQELQDKVSDLQRQNENKKERSTDEESREVTRWDEQGDTETDPDALTKEEEVATLIAQLKKRIVELEIGREFRKKEDDDQVALLREQVNVCVEDFKQERKDRERIHEENLRLRQRLALTDNQVCSHRF